MNYEHTQTSPLDDLLFLLAASGGVSAWAFSHEPPVAWGLAAFTLMMMLVGLCFGQLTVRDEGDVLAVRYGPLPVFWKTIRYDRITVVEAGRSSFIDGWGIHFVPGRGWTFNLWGFDCVVLHFGAKVIRIGSDDSIGLAEFLRNKVVRTMPAQVTE